MKIHGPEKNVWVLMLSEIAFSPTPLVGSKSTTREGATGEGQVARQDVAMRGGQVRRTGENVK